MVYDGDFVAKSFHLAHDVGREDHCETIVAALLDEAHDGLGGHDIEPGGGLVKNHDWGAMDDGAGDGYALFLSCGKLVAAPLLEIADFELLDEFVDTSAECCSGDAVELTEVLEHLAGGEAPVKRGSVREEADGAANIFWLFDDIESGDRGSTLGRLEQSAEHPQGGGLAGSVGSEESEYLTWLAGECDTVDGSDEPAFPVAEGFGELVCFDHG